MEPQKYGCPPGCDAKGAFFVALMMLTDEDGLPCAMPGKTFADHNGTELGAVQAPWMSVCAEPIRPVRF